ncbi:hypothetical protein AALO_G00253850 [Alosa alosa]|uniref:Uncharacterized protein n=1 Tax=Alosa alosa TaxID=278164 RepID=A0AAV6FPM1_9TELE|nr:hypothetical protein AALO_G00253850 [Alosa alosa]
MRIPTTTPSWWSVPNAPRRGVGDTSPTYMGVRPVKMPQKRPMTRRPAMTISKEEQRVESPIRAPPIRARMFTRNMAFRLCTGDGDTSGQTDRQTHQPAEFVGYDSHTEGPGHATHAEDGHRQTPHDGAGAWLDGLPIALHPGAVEEGSQFLTHNMTDRH